MTNDEMLEQQAADARARYERAAAENSESLRAIRAERRAVDARDQHAVDRPNFEGFLAELRAAIEGPVIGDPVRAAEERAWLARLATKVESTMILLERGCG